MFGLGCSHAHITVYIANTPNLLEYQQLTNVLPLTQGELTVIGQHCGNGWRKVFNVYAKLLYALPNTDFSFSHVAPTWQQYRDNYLLQHNSQTALLFSAPRLLENNETLHIICGRTYAKQLIKSGELKAQLHWIDEEFAIDKNKRVVVCPYFDYRQLSNAKITRLATMLAAIK